MAKSEKVEPILTGQIWEKKNTNGFIIILEITDIKNPNHGAPNQRAVVYEQPQNSCYSTTIDKNWDNRFELVYSGSHDKHCYNKMPVGMELKRLCNESYSYSNNGYGSPNYNNHNNSGARTVGEDDLIGGFAA